MSSPDTNLQQPAPQEVPAQPAANPAEPPAETPEAAPAQPEAAPEPSLEEKLQSAQGEVARLTEQLKRVAAEAENYRKRLDTNFERRVSGAKEEIFRSLLPIIDHLEMALEAAHKGGTLESLCQGIELVLKDALKIMHKYEVSAIEAQGQNFDPSCHEAVMMEERTDLPDESVSEVFKKGYKIGDKVLRPSMVKVARRPQ